MVEAFWPVKCPCSFFCRPVFFNGLHCRISARHTQHLRQRLVKFTLMKEKLDYRTSEAKDLIERLREIEWQESPDWFPFSKRLLSLRLKDIEALFTFNEN